MFSSGLKDCKECRGEKVVISDPCLSCRGRGLLYQPAREDARVPPGVDTGAVLRMRGRGGRALGRAESGDLLIEVVVKEDPKFRREGLHLHSEQEIPLSQALLGGNVVLDTVEGQIAYPLDECVGLEVKIELEEMGMPTLKGDKRRGSHFVNLKARLPKRLSAEQRKILEQLRRTEQREQ